MTFARLLVSISLLGLIACDTETPTMVVVDNGYPAVPDGGDSSTEMTVFQVWWGTLLLPDPVAPAGQGQAQRAVPNADFAYALLAPGWDPTVPSPPTRLIAARSATKLSVARGDTLHVHVSADAFVGNCAAGKPLSQVEADLVTTQIFPGEFAGTTYDAVTCAAAGQPTDGGVPGDGASE